MKKSSRNTRAIALSTPALRRLAAGALLCCASVAMAQSGGAGNAAGNTSGNGAALNFVNADIESVIKAVGHYTGMTFIIDPRIKGTLTLVSERTLSKSQAFALLTSALRLQGFAVVTGDGYAKVVPEAEAKLQSSPTNVGTRGGSKVQGDQVATQIYHLNYESAANLTAVLRPLISPNNSIMANPGNNSLVITDYADNLQRLSKIIAALDAPVSSDLDVVPIRYAIASDVATLVSRLMEPATGGDSGRVSILPDPRTNSVVVRAPSAARANLAKSLIAKLDQPTSEAGNVHVVYLKNADATKLAQTLRAVVSQDTSAPQTQQGTQGGSVQTTGGASSTANSGGLQGQNGTNLGGSGNTFANQNQNSGGSGGQGSGFIQADASTNTLIITAPEAVYRNLRAVIEQLDVRRAQVYIESLIVEVSSNKASEFGVQWLGLSGDSKSSYRVGALQSFSTGSNNIVNLAAAAASGTATSSTAPAGFSLGVFRQVGGALGLGAIAHALETDGNANILSTPNMLTLDNELATIKVGKNVPIISGSFTTTSGTSTNPFQTIDRKDVGLTLKVRPQISEGGTIKMAIYHETSSVDASTATSAAGITTNIRVIENNVIADDGQIIVLGGLIEDTEGDSEEKVRGLGSIPIIGNLFKYKTRSRNKTNLMVFLRPVVVRSKEASSTIAMDRYDFMRGAGQSSQPETGNVLLRDLGAPVLPALTNGQPPGGGAMAPVPAPTPSTTRAAPGQPGSQIAPGQPGIRGQVLPAPGEFRPVQPVPATQH
ncbi:MAG: type II secretion system secretin GspD [Pseudomonadota bacterium]|nr:type II secretion system secretin GspD [Pseudomonadota bacterium]